MGKKISGSMKAQRTITDVIVHILHRDERETYAIEKFWSNAFSVSEDEWKEISKDYRDF